MKSDLKKEQVQILVVLKNVFHENRQKKVAKKTLWRQLLHLFIQKIVLQYGGKESTWSARFSSTQMYSTDPNNLDAGDYFPWKYLCERIPLPKYEVRRLKADSVVENKDTTFVELNLRLYSLESTEILPWPSPSQNLSVVCLFQLCTRRSTVTTRKTHSVRMQTLTINWTCNIFFWRFSKTKRNRNGCTLHGTAIACRCMDLARKFWCCSFQWFPLWYQAACVVHA